MRTCPICDKTSQMVGNYSNRVRATQFNPTGKKRKQPNLQWAALPPQAGGGRLKICTSCLKRNRHLEIKMI
ncbi:MAG TPA: hypothetical protein VI752_01720 [Candidatus Paceibacterota bacterium]|jgi:ribosomal protein L28|nr:hypothetical protein [Patescibacteria group bacterium]